YAELDGAILAGALDALRRFEAIGARGVVGASVHASTLRHQRTRNAYFAMLGAAPHALLQRLVIKVAEVDAGAPMWTLTEWAAQLRAHVRQAAFEMHHSERGLDQLADTKAWAVGFQMPPHRPDAPEAAHRLLLSNVSHWLRMTQRQNLHLFVEQPRSLKLVSAMKQMGVDFMTSEALWPARPDPQDAYSAPLFPGSAPGSGRHRAA
ncbi:MAG: hypothetical protein AB7O04_08945, partial [Hyphomonadaceae bacterium]